MKPRTTYTVVTLEVSQAIYDEIAGKLRAAGYGHCFPAGDGGVIDMTGIGIEAEKPDDVKE